MSVSLLQLCKEHRKIVEKRHNWRQTNKRVHWRTECHSVYYDSAKNMEKTWKEAKRDCKQTKWPLTDWMIYIPFTATLQRTQNNCGLEEWQTNRYNHWQTEWHSIYCAKNTKTDFFLPLTDWMIFYLLCKEHRKTAEEWQSNRYHWQTEWHSVYYDSAKNIEKLWQKALNDSKQTKLQFLDWLNDNVPFTKTKKKRTEKLSKTVNDH